MQECFFYIFQSCDGVRLMTKISLMCSIFFKVEESGKYGKDLFAYLVDLEKVYYNGLSNFGGFCQENSVDGQLLHAIKAFYGADWSFVVE